MVGSRANWGMASPTISNRFPFNGKLEKPWLDSIVFGIFIVLLTRGCKKKNSGMLGLRDK